VNDSFTGTNRLLAAGEDVYWLKTEFSANGRTYPPGTIYIPAKATTAPLLSKLAAEIGLNFDATATKPQGQSLKLHPVKIGLWDRFGGSMDSGHIQWMFEQAFPTTYQIVYAPTLDAGDLRSKFDILIFPGGALPDVNGGGRGGGRGGGGGGRGGGGGTGRGGAGVAGGRGSRGAMEAPDEYKGEMGNITLEKTGPQLRKFVEEGGTILAIGSSTGFGSYLGVPVTSALTEKSATGADERLSATKFYVPGSVLQVSVDNTVPIAYGLPDKVDIFYDNSPAFRLIPNQALKDTHPVAWFASPEPLRSGWAWGQNYLNGAAEAVSAKVGEGEVYLFAPEITFRGQPHGTFKFLFNAIDLAGATSAVLP
jgi:hypothetical protein